MDKTFFAIDIENTDLIVSKFKNKNHFEKLVKKSIPLNLNKKFQCLTLQEVSYILETEKENECVVLLGLKKDPLDDPFTAMSTISNLLETISYLNLKKLIIKTRSPFMLLLIPALKTLKSKLEVIYCFETFSDNSTYMLTPGAPRFSEKIECLKTFKKKGFMLNINLAPMISSSSDMINIPKDLVLLLNICDDINLTFFHEIKKTDNYLLSKEVHQKCLKIIRKYKKNEINFSSLNSNDSEDRTAA